MAGIMARRILQILPELRSSSILQVKNTQHHLPLCWNSHAVLEQITAPRTSVNQPSLHTKDHLGLWYRLNPEVLKQLYSLGGIPKKYVVQSTTFNETCLMVREPALTVIDLIKRSNLSLPPNKFMLYGRDGAGKSLSLTHILHYLAEDGWLLIHLPVPSQWRRNVKEVVPSSSVPGRFDHPLQAAVWLQHFRSQNSELMKTLQLKTSMTYTWTRRESTEAGSPLMALVEQGINRARFASDSIMALTTEIKKYATDGRCKVAVVVDGINTFYCPDSLYRREDRTIVEPDNFTLFQAFSQLFQSDWKNGVVVGTIDRLVNDAERRESHLPRYLLRRKGWEKLDPFIPIPVNDYNNLEMESAINYYIDRHWLQTVNGSSEQGRKELAALSGCNPLMLMKVCNAL
ncbi:28S ribosomal protein S29, mitochondrial-like [Penaeus japonicus]|uniref:28S ribosomal protein S29, mitochondrial-like n=1 Tax=Penaeus japonicus TaxID=27405 RepID=UPI001C715504|nr:28S ribosomal protein S29, mitochondrial-like [Penaeus japonicus]